MLTRQENELLTRVGPGTPCGELMRRYWQPAALSEELPPGGAPLPVRLLGEDLVLFRDEQGRPGLLGIHCSHRAADLSYGRLEDGGLRCLYHGWLYDVDGNCLEQPGEPRGDGSGMPDPYKPGSVGARHASPFREKIHHPAYPCRDVGGLILAYMGPGEPPLVPNYRFLTAPDECRFSSKIFHDCNYLQGNEGNFDSVHLSFLHGGDPINGANNRGYERIETLETDYGLRMYYLRPAEPGMNEVHITNFAMPNLGVIGTGHTVNWHVPIDDTTHWKYYVQCSPRPIDHEAVRRGRSELTPDYRLLENKSNRYLQDREMMKTATYSGIGTSYQPQDACVTEGEGPVQDRLEEHLGYSDRAIIVARQLMLRAIQAVQAGQDPPHVVRDPSRNDFSDLWGGGATIPASKPWQECTREEVWPESLGGRRVARQAATNTRRLVAP